MRKKQNDLKEKYNKYINMYSSILKTFLFNDDISQENLMLVVEYKNKKQQAEIELNELNRLIEELPNVSYKSVLHSILMYKKSLEKQSTEIKKIIKLFINKIYLFDEWIRYEINFGPLLSETISKSEIQIIGQFDITRLEIKLFLEQDLNYKIEFKNLNIKKKEE